MLPLTINPMLAAKAEAPFDSEHHLFEIKWDGIRCLAFVEGGRVRLQSRLLTENTFQFPELASLAGLPTGTVLDGELVVFQNDKPSLAEIQRRALLQNCSRIQDLSRIRPVSYMVFDLLFLRNRPLTAAPLSVRREALIELYEQFPLPGFLLSEGLRQCGRELFAQIMRLGLEEMMAIDLTSATDDKGQLLCREAGFKLPVAITRAAWAKVIEAGGTWKSDGEGEILGLKGGQSLTGRLWDLLWLLRSACGRASNDDRVHFQVLVDVKGDGRRELVRLWALCGPGDDAAPVITVMLEGED